MARETRREWRTHRFPSKRARHSGGDGFSCLRKKRPYKLLIGSAPGILETGSPEIKILQKRARRSKSPIGRSTHYWGFRFPVVSHLGHGVPQLGQIAIAGAF